MAYEQTSSRWDELVIEEAESMYNLEQRLLDYAARTITQSTQSTQRKPALDKTNKTCAFDRKTKSG